jgi:hypothetical protein
VRRAPIAFLWREKNGGVPGIVKSAKVPPAGCQLCQLLPTPSCKAHTRPCTPPHTSLAVHTPVCEVHTPPAKHCTLHSQLHNPPAKQCTHSVLHVQWHAHPHQHTPPPTTPLHTTHLLPPTTTARSHSHCRVPDCSILSQIPAGRELPHPQHCPTSMHACTRVSSHSNMSITHVSLLGSKCESAWSACHPHCMQGTPTALQPCTTPFPHWKVASCTPK